MGTVAIGPGTLGLAAAWASGPNAYFEESEWTVAAEYAIQATDKFKITPAVQYFDNVKNGSSAPTVTDFSNTDVWKAGVTLDYQIVENFYAKASVQWQDKTLTSDSDAVSGYFRLQRAF